MKYRFTAEDFARAYPATIGIGFVIDLETAACLAVRANALLEQWERESEKIYAFTRSGPWDLWYRYSKADPQTHTAILWNPKEIEK